MPRVTQNPPVRSFLLVEVAEFVRRARACAGVRKIVLVGSLATEKRDPKDADVLVIVEDEADLAAIASAGRKLLGRAQSRNKGADIFLASPSGRYIGRTCRWRACHPGKRMSCRAQHCGQRPFLYDDLDVIELDDALIESPPIELWPGVIRRVQVPADVEEVLLRSLETMGPGVRCSDRDPS